MGKFKDLTGKRFGRLVVIGLAGRDEKNKKLLWSTICDCGNTKVVVGERLINGETASCGCLKKDLIKQRCTKPMIGKVFRQFVAHFRVRIGDKASAFIADKPKTRMSKILDFHLFSPYIVILQTIEYAFFAFHFLSINRSA